MPNPTDIVTVLRQEMFYQPTSRLNEFGKPQMGFELTRTNLLAADEIERLRKELDARIAMCDMRSEKIGELANERDEARREVCDLKAFNFDDTITADGYADLRKWDCFKKKTLKDCLKENTNV